MIIKILRIKYIFKKNKTKRFFNMLYIMFTCNTVIDKYVCINQIQVLQGLLILVYTNMNQTDSPFVAFHITDEVFLPAS